MRKYVFKNKSMQDKKEYIRQE